MQIQIISFGQIAEVTGKDKFSLEASDTDGLQMALNQKYPALNNKKYAIAVNKQLITANAPLTQNAEVALLPPFSGG